MISGVIALVVGLCCIFVGLGLGGDPHGDHADWGLTLVEGGVVVVAGVGPIAIIVGLIWAIVLRFTQSASASSEEGAPGLSVLHEGPANCRRPLPHRALVASSARCNRWQPGGGMKPCGTAGPS